MLKKFLLLTVGGLLALHVNFASAQTDNEAAPQGEKTEGCVLDD